MIPGLPNLYLAGALALASFVGGAWVTNKINSASYAKLELSYAQAEAKAVEKARAEQARYDAIATAAAQREAAAQAKAAGVARRRLQEVERYVKNNRGCITYGLVRVLDAAVHGVLAGSLSLPAGKSDDACAPITAVALARSVSDNYAAHRANEQQLNALIATFREMQRK